MIIIFEVSFLLLYIHSETKISLALALNAWILSKFSTFHWISLLFILLVSVSVELPLAVVVTLSYNVFCGQVEFKIVLFYLYLSI